MPRSRRAVALLSSSFQAGVRRRGKLRSRATGKAKKSSPGCARPRRPAADAHPNRVANDGTDGCGSSSRRCCHRVGRRADALCRLAARQQRVWRGSTAPGCRSFDDIQAVDRRVRRQRAPVGRPADQHAGQGHPASVWPTAQRMKLCVTANARRAGAGRCAAVRQISAQPAVRRGDASPVPPARAISGNGARTSPRFAQACRPCGVTAPRTPARRRRC